MSDHTYDVYVDDKKQYSITVSDPDAVYKAFLSSVVEHSTTYGPGYYELVARDIEQTIIGSATIEWYEGD